ncbi:hypothetical protein IXB28_07695 [Leptothoe kymatousa TAU-MAC 1615]|uniref:Uncharacterized protein n=2 Tax=Leptothoe TaxID=2651725 RepID=A0ABS5Y533_9CYAN|nr:hypothetical protein [Leptothoe kymatousa TAU-MAC 1615]
MEMSSIQTGQLISLLINNVLMVITGAIVVLAAWLRWRWLLTTSGYGSPGKRRQCRWAYLSFLLTVVMLFGMLASLSALALRAIVALNVLVVGAMVFFLLGVLALVGALGLWFWDMFSPVEFKPSRRPRQRTMLHAPAVTLMSVAMSVGDRSRRKRGPRRLRR